MTINQPNAVHRIPQRKAPPRTSRSGDRKGQGSAPKPGTVAAAAVFLACAASAATAADPRDQAPQAWSGLFVGGGLNAAWGSSSWATRGPASDVANGTFDYFKPYDAFKGTGSYEISAQAGRNWRLPNGLVLGVVADVHVPSLLSKDTTLASANIGNASIAEKVKLTGTVRGRIGVVHDSWLWYGTGGYAWAWDAATRTQNAGTPVGGSAIPGTSEESNFFRNGWAAGGGVEMPVAANWTANFEYLFTSFGTSAATFSQGAQRFSSDLNLQSVRLGLNYQFDAKDVAKGDFTVKPLSVRDFSVQGQMTYAQQYALPFHAPYVGQNSLISNQTRQTFDATFYLGWRPWEGAEIWLNPEIDQGFGLANTLGLAGFSSGEAYKIGSAEPYARLHRSFIRQTFNISGESEKVEQGPNQFATTQRSNRVVVTVGKFGATDIFDTNKYAHDPRSDFLNWSLIDTGSFDYAADAWGYTYGAAIEWYFKGWAIRGGIFDLPTVPNSTQLDPTFGQFQWMGEIERRYEVWGNPGKVAVTGFLTRARMGRFADAIAVANATAQPADIAGVRDYRSRTGISFNMEQQITPTIGFFARAGWSDGSAEPFAFTDIDRTAAAGLVFSGKAWGRPDDSLGMAGVVNGISKVHQEFFNAGGLGILLGDGQLSRPAGERIFETYYSLPVSSWRLAFDYQYVTNPGYNTERGPVSIIGTRLRTSF